jgi:pyruvate,water dikinase
VVDADCAGVAFSVDAIANNPDVVVVSAAWGLGIGCVDGTVATDTYRVRRNAMFMHPAPAGLSGLDVEERRVAVKPERIGLGADGGVRALPVPEERQRSACLPDLWLRRVATFALAAEALFGRPQDIEWAVADDALWVLQSRPITALAPGLARRPFPVTWPCAEAGRKLWVIDRLSRHGVPLPLEDEVNETFGLARGEAALQNGMSIFGADVMEEQMSVHGRRYLASGPITLPPGDRRTRTNATRDLYAFLHRQGMSVWDYNAVQVVPATERLAAVDLGALDGPALADHLEDAFGVFRRNFVAHWLGGRDPMGAAYRAAYGKVAGLVGPAADDAAMQLVQGEESILTRLIDALYELGCAARAIPAVARIVEQRPEDAVTRLADLPEAEPFTRRLTEFLALYQDRSGAGYGSTVSVCTPTWRDDPTPVLAFVAPYLDPAVPAPSLLRERARAERDARVAALCAACADADAVVKLMELLPGARRRATALEDHNHYIDELSYGQLRAAIRTAGRWLTARGAISTVDDVFWLRRDEIVGALHGRAAPALGDVIDRRRAQHAIWETLPPPPVLGLPAQRLPPRPLFRDDSTATIAARDGRLVGQGASPGRARGRARVVAMETVMPRVLPGEILVAENAGPMWTPLFPILGGLVLDQGALLQHASATAREYGVPAVINVGNATSRIGDGDWVTVDGTTGIVELA